VRYFLLVVSMIIVSRELSITASDIPDDNDRVVSHTLANTRDFTGHLEKLDSMG
jgi:hypothetical protein